MDLFEVEIIYQKVTSLNNIEEEDDEIDRLRGVDDYYIDVGYWDLETDPIAKIEPRCFIPKGKTNKKYFSEVVFQSGNLSYANYKPTELKKMLDSYLNKG